MASSSVSQVSPARVRKKTSDNPASIPRLRKIYIHLKRLFESKNPNKRYPTLAQIAELIRGNDEKALSTDTVFRCLEMMRNNLDLPVDFVPEFGGHGFTQPVGAFPLDFITEEQMYLLIQSVQMLAIYREKKVYQQMRKLVKKSCLAATMALGVEFEEIEDALSFHVIGFDAPAPVDPDLFKAVMRAILERQVVTLDHRSVKRPGEVTQKTVEALHLSMINHALYFWHYDPSLEGKKDEDGAPIDPIRKFALTRIENLKMTNRKVKPRKFNIHEQLKHGMGAYNGKDAKDVEIRFTAKIAPYIMERKWHSTQVVTKHEDGGITLGLRVAHTPELEGFVIRWAGEVEVKTPGKLRKRMADLGKSLWEAHPAIAPEVHAT